MDFVSSKHEEVDSVSQVIREIEELERHGDTGRCMTVRVPPRREAEILSAVQRRNIVRKV